MNLKIEDSWKTELLQEFKKPYFKELINFVSNEYEKESCFPEKDAIFAAFNTCAYDKVRVVIIGQDPYHGENQANGLCFSVNDRVSLPPSLVNIFKEVATDLNQEPSTNGNLERWAKQGVLLLNATLTVRSNAPGSHQKKGWEEFTDFVIKNLSEKREGLIFLLWGGFAKKKAKIIDNKKHYILSSGHPSPLSANRGYWFGNKHFSKANEILTKKNQPNIAW